MVTLSCQNLWQVVGGVRKSIFPIIGSVTMSWIRAFGLAHLEEKNIFWKPYATLINPQIDCDFVYCVVGSVEHSQSLFFFSP